MGAKILRSQIMQEKQGKISTKNKNWYSGLNHLMGNT